MIKCLSINQQIEILEEKSKIPRVFTNKQLADIYNVSERTIGRIKIKNNTNILEKKEKSVNNNVCKDDFDWSDPKLVSYVATPSSISISTPNGTATVTYDKKNYHKIFEYLSKGEIKKAYLHANIKEKIQYYSYENVEFKNEKLYYNNTEIDSSITRMIIEMIKNDDDWYKTLISFFNNLMENPSYRAVNELYKFLKHNDIQITDDGCFYALKMVTEDFKDKRTRSFDNSVGSIVKMQRNQVDENSNKTCSHGLHVCTMEYIKAGVINSFNDKIVKVKVNPKNVVSIPIDYNNSKMRCCEYEVIEDVTNKI